MKAAVEKHQKENVHQVSHVSKFVIGIELDEGWQCPPSVSTTDFKNKFDMTKYVHAVSSCLGVGPEKVVAKERNFLLSITYSFPKSEAFFYTQTLTNWVRAIEAVLRRRSGDGTMQIFSAEVRRRPACRV